MDTHQAIKSRLSIRSYLDREVRREEIEELLEVARWAPSGGNIQPWKVVIVSGDTKQRISADIVSAFTSGIQPHPDIMYYPDKWFEPYKSRRFACGLELYRALGIERANKEKRTEAWLQNYTFFGAPVGLLFFLEQTIGGGAWVDLGILLQSIMLSAHAMGLGTCPQATLADYPDIVRRHLHCSSDWLLMCGMALGYPDLDAPVNQYRTSREPVGNICQWFD